MSQQFTLPLLFCTIHRGSSRCKEEMICTNSDCDGEFVQCQNCINVQSAICIEIFHSHIRDIAPAKVLACDKQLKMKMTKIIW